MAKFEAGDKVKIVALDTRWCGYYKYLNDFLGKTADVLVVPSPDGEEQLYYIKDSNNTTCFMPESWLELVEKKKPEYWTGQIVITDEGSSDYFTTGKVYKVKKGLLYDNTRTPYSCVTAFKNFDDVKTFFEKRSSAGIKCIEFKGFANKEDE